MGNICDVIHICTPNHPRSAARCQPCNYWAGRTLESCCTCLSVRHFIEHLTQGGCLETVQQTRLLRAYIIFRNVLRTYPNSMGVRDGFNGHGYGAPEAGSRRHSGTAALLALEGRLSLSALCLPAHAAGVVVRSRAHAACMVDSRKSIFLYL